MSRDSCPARAAPPLSQARDSCLRELRVPRTIAYVVRSKSLAISLRDSQDNVGIRFARTAQPAQAIDRATVKDDEQSALADWPGLGL